MSAPLAADVLDAPTDDVKSCGSREACWNDPPCDMHARIETALREHADYIDGSEVDDEMGDEEDESIEEEEDESRPAAFSKRQTYEDFRAAIWARVDADHGDFELRERTAVACEARGGVIAAAVVRAIGARGIVTAAMFANEGDVLGFADLEQYAADRWDRATNLSMIATRLIDCPSCYVYETHHDHSGRRQHFFPCDPREYAATTAAEAEAVRKQYVQGATIGGYPGYAKHGEFVVTRSAVGVKKPSWCKASPHSFRWNVDFDRQPGYAMVNIPRTRRAEYCGDPAEYVFIEFRRADRVAGAQVGLFA